MEVGPPLPRRLVRLPALHRVFEIEVVLEMIATALGGLRQIDRLGEALQRGDLLVRHLADKHRRRFLQLHDRDAGVHGLLERERDVLKADGLMTMSNVTPRCRRSALIAVSIRICASVATRAAAFPV